jgi:predicted AAA+ superfamily ATPase
MFLSPSELGSSLLHVTETTGLPTTISQIVIGYSLHTEAIHSSVDAFVATLANGRVVTWGNQRHGGDSSSVKTKLRAVETVCSTGSSAFSAKLVDGRVVTWGV